MREYAKVSGRFWNGETGKQLRTAGRDSQIVGLYLVTCPSSNMLGLYYLPLPTLCHEVGITKEGASKALRRVSEAHFAFYDELSEHVWVPEMARWQIGPSLDPKDKRIIGIKRELESLRKSPFFNEFVQKYREPFHLHDVKPEVRPSDAPSMSHRSQEQEQEKEQDREPNSAARRRQSLSQFEINDQIVAWCHENQISIVTAQEELPRFKDWCLSKGKIPKDVYAAFRNWLRKSKEFQSKNSNGHRQQQFGGFVV
jgi:hypothetical protein